MACVFVEFMEIAAKKDLMLAKKECRAKIEEFLAMV